MRLIVLFISIFCIFSCTKKVDKDTIVGIQPYKGISKAKIDAVAKEIKDYYNLKVIVLPERELPKGAFVTIKSPRYRADKIIAFQKQNKIKSVDYIIGLTDKDISITKKINGRIKSPEWKYNDWGIMGLAYCPGNSCIVSNFRIKNKVSEIEMIRLKKVTIHEFGHNLGLPHCLNKKCVMTDAVENIATIDHADLALCKKCKLKI